MVLKNVNRWLRADRTSYHYKNAAFVLALIISLGCVMLYFSWSVVPYREYTMTYVIRDMYGRKLNTDIGMNLGLGRDIMDNSADNEENMLRVRKYSITLSTFAEADSNTTVRKEEVSKDFPYYGQLCDSLTARGLPTDHDMLLYAELGDQNLNRSYLEKVLHFPTSPFYHSEPKLVEIDGEWQLYLNPKISRKQTLQGERQKVCEGIKGNSYICRFVTGQYGTIFYGALALEDISQTVVKIQFNPDNKKDILQGNIKNLHINFGTVADLSPIHPEPDIITATSIKYTDEAKIKQVLADGLSFHMKYPLWANVQSTRMFLLATILTFALNTIAGFLIVFVVSLSQKFKFKNK